MKALMYLNSRSWLKIVICLFGLLFIVVGWLIAEFVSIWLFNAKIERIFEKNLPKVAVENGNIVYCRMSADDFRLSLPAGSRVVHANILSGGSDWVDVEVEIRQEKSNVLTSVDFEEWIKERLQIGASVSFEEHGDITLIKCHYFGDR